MKKLLSTAVCLFALFCVTNAQANDVKPSGKIVSEERNVGQFGGVSSSSGIDVYITISPVFSVSVKADSNLIEYVETKVSKGVLRIGYNKSLNNRNNVRTAVYITMPEVEALEASSASDIKVSGVITGGNLKASTSSAASITAIIKCDKLTASASSGADIKLKGEVGECTASASSGSDMDLEELSCRVATVSASSGADVEILVTEKITASASSGADIVYYGNPVSVQVSQSSGGGIKGK